MQLGSDPYAGLTYDQWLERNPIPDKWLARLERDEAEMEAEQRLLPQPATRRAVTRARDKAGGGRLSGNPRRGYCTATVGIPAAALGPAAVAYSFAAAVAAADLR